MSKQGNTDGEGDTPPVYVISESILGILCPVVAFTFWEAQTGIISEENCKTSRMSENCALYWDSK